MKATEISQKVAFKNLNIYLDKATSRSICSSIKLGKSTLTPVKMGFLCTSYQTYLKLKATACMWLIAQNISTINLDISQPCDSFPHPTVRLMSDVEK
jgi:hypothetical protein